VSLRLPRRLLLAEEVARLLRLTPRVFRRRRAELEAAGFPPPLPGLPDRWDRAAIEAWLDRQIPAAAPQDPARALERTLISRAGSLAQPR
jgi:predicted DNA-binding transcriptional regulator AlpA